MKRKCSAVRASTDGMGLNDVCTLKPNEKKCTCVPGSHSRLKTIAIWNTRFLALRATARWNVLPRLTRSGTGISSRSMNNYLEVNCSLLVIFSVDYQSWSVTKKPNRKTIEKLTWNGLSKSFDGDQSSICWICVNVTRKKYHPDGLPAPVFTKG